MRLVLRSLVYESNISYRRIVSQRVKFTLPTASQIRLYSEPNEIDIDFRLQQDDHIELASAVADVNEEEELVYSLHTGINYTLLIQYFNQQAAYGYSCSVRECSLSRFLTWLS